MKTPFNLYEILGKNENSATIISCLIAVFKGTFRPIFTMMDKSQDPKTKKYAAIREAVTEVAALPLYIITPIIMGGLVKKFYKGNYGKRAATISKFIGVCIATTIVPFACNVIQPKIMDALQKRDRAKLANKPNDQVIQPQTQIGAAIKPQTPVATFSASKMNYGMKVGG